MKQQKPTQRVGVWIDNDKAILLTPSPHPGEGPAIGEFSILQTIDGKVHHGGRGGEHAMNNAKRSDALTYFKAVAAELVSYDEILIFGPGKSQEQFQHHLGQDLHFRETQITIDASGHLTEPQMIAKVRDFFKGRQP